MCVHARHDGQHSQLCYFIVKTHLLQFSSFFTLLFDGFVVRPSFVFMFMLHQRMVGASSINVVGEVECSSDSWLDFQEI